MKKAKKLVLARETVLKLEAPVLEDVVAGQSASCAGTCQCQSVWVICRDPTN